MKKATQLIVFFLLAIVFGVVTPSFAQSTQPASPEMVMGYWITNVHSYYGAGFAVELNEDVEIREHLQAIKNGTEMINLYQNGKRVHQGGIIQFAGAIQVVKIHAGYFGNIMCTNSQDLFPVEVVTGSGKKFTILGFYDRPGITENKLVASMAPAIPYIPAK